MADFVEPPVSVPPEQKHGNTLPSTTSTFGSSTEFEETEPSGVPESSTPPQSQQVKLVPPPKEVAEKCPSNLMQEEVPVELKGPASPNYGAEMTPFQQKVANVTCCFSFSVILVTVVAVVALALTNRVQRPRREALKECGQGHCSRELRYLDAVVDTAVDPCSDFYAYMCNRWSGRHAGAGFLQDAFDKFFGTLATAVLQTRPAVFGGEAQVFQVGKTLLQDCIGYMNAEKPDLPRDVTSVLNVLNLSALLASNSSRVALVLSLNMSFATGLHCLVAITRRKKRQGGITYLYLYRTPSLRQELRAQTEDDGLYLYIHSLINLISPSEQNASTAGARDVIDIDSVLESFDTDERKETWLLPEVLKRDTSFPEGVWREAFRSFRVGGLVDVDVDEVLFSGYRQTSSVFRHLDYMPAPATTWYLAMLFLAQALRVDYARRYQSGRTRDQEYLCLDAVNRALELHWHNFVSNLTFAGLVGDSELDVMFRRLREKIVPAWLSNETALMAQEKLSALSYRAYVPSGDDAFTGTPGYNMTYVAQEADAALSRPFPGNYVALRILTQRETVLARPPDAAEAEMARLWAHPWPVYNEVPGTVILPSAYLDRPLMYARSATPEVNYATVGVVMAKALANAIGPNSRWNATSSGSWWGTEASFSYSMLAGCLRQHSDPNVIANPMDPQPRRSAAFKSSLFSWMRAARAGLDALRDQFRGSNRTEKQWGRAQRVFFKRFCLLSCGSERWDAMSPLERCTWPLLSMPEFRDAFSCRNDTIEHFDSTCASL
ncbi:uncharacterized protein LOC125939889 [Dermacentor silvarum]|uniref:uncharacterized protein LOC125939889 n=1 Tax=Dermacentor silvarum TaxID=543639 RepID=UPI002101B6C6|nr:uncharacterized protein LOC125939889 [Dermacentor silvarum]